MNINFACPNCRQSLEIDESGAGITIDCPKCSKPVYVPSLSGAASLQSPIKVAVKPIRQTNSMLPAIEGGLHCFLIAAGLYIVSFLAFRSDHLIACMVVSLFGAPFMAAALLCAVYGICKGSINHGLALLAGVGVLFLLSFSGPLWNMWEITRYTEQMQKQTEQMMRQFHP
jgi:hypothetical protein